MTKIFHSKSFQIIRLRLEIYTKKAKIGQQSAFLTTKNYAQHGSKSRT